MEFVCPDPTATVRGANIRATLDAFELLPSVGQSILDRHHLSLIDLFPDKFVLVQRWLDALKEIQEQIGRALVRQVGARIIENADFPPQFDSVEVVLESLDAIYYLNHRGDVGHYRTSREQCGALVVRCETPYPSDFELGLIEGICRSRVARGRHYKVDFERVPQPNIATCILTVRAVG